MFNELTYRLLRPALFAMDPETAHDTLLEALAKSQNSPLQWLYAQPRVSDPVSLAGLTFPNRVGLAAGLDKNARCIDALAALGFGFIEVGTVTPLGQTGHPKPRIFRLPEREALINRLGFNNDGLQTFLKHVKQARSVGQVDGMKLGLNIGKNAATPMEQAVDDYLLGFKAVYPYADYITINISSPNTQNLRHLQADTALDGLLSALAGARSELNRTYQRQVPIFVKISPDLDDSEIDHIACMMKQRASDSSDGAWGLISTNTTVDRGSVAGLPDSHQTGGLSGAPLLEKSNQVLRRLRHTLGADFPIIGVGGILSGTDAVSKIQAGADLVQIYTGLIYRGPALVSDAATSIRAMR